MEKTNFDYKLIIGGIVLFLLGMMLGNFGWVILFAAALGYYAYWKKQQSQSENRVGEV